MKKKVILEGKEIGEVEKPDGATQIDLQTGVQDGHITKKTYKIESEDGNEIHVTENPLLG